MVKMLTPDGKLVEVDKAILEQAISKAKSLQQSTSSTG